MEHGFTWVQRIPGLMLLEPHTATAMIVMVGLLIFALRARQQMAAAGDSAVPDGGFSARNIAEVLTQFISDLSESVIGHEGHQYVPLFASFFVFILFSNLIGLIPGFSPPTDNFNVTLGLGVVAFAAYNVYGFREHGFAYLKQFMGPMLLLAPLMLIVELFSHAFRPISLSIRLFGNMFADHLLLGLFTDLTKLVIPVVFYLLGTFVSLVQALVFTLLTMVYVSLAISHEH